jgi:hypothetical protein
MLECPVCSELVLAPDSGVGFECPVCGNWIRRRITLERAPLQRPAVAPTSRRASQAPARNFPAINQMDLPSVQAERRQIETRLRELEAEIDRVFRLRSQNPASDELRRYNTELGQYTSEQNRLRDRDQRLQERAATLEAEQARSRQSGGSGPAIAFVYGSLLAIGVMYALTRAINLTLDPRAIGVAALIAVAAGFLTFLIALFL